MFNGTLQYPVYKNGSVLTQKENIALKKSPSGLSYLNTFLR